MADPSHAIRAYMVGSFQELPPSIIQDLENGSLSLLSIVKLLGESLLDEQDEVRTRAVHFLADILAHFLPTNPSNQQRKPLEATPSQDPPSNTTSIFTPQVVKTLTTFFSEKLSDAVLIAENFAKSSKAPQPLPASAPMTKLKEVEQQTIRGSDMLVACLNALNCLSACHGHTPNQPRGFGVVESHKVSEALFSNLRTSDHPQSLRFLVYSLLDSLVAHHRSNLKSYKSAATLAAEAAAMAEDDSDDDAQSPGDQAITGDKNKEEGEEAMEKKKGSKKEDKACVGKDFLKGYVKLVSGEKDPRNLMVLFGVDKVLLTEWEMDTELTEAFFDITYCYFPISFRPPPDDPYGITSDDLKLALRGVLSSTPSFAPYGYPLLLEKLSAAGGPAKLDTLRTLIASLPVYGRAAAKANSKSLWEALKIEIFHATDEETSQLSCRALTQLVTVMYEGVDPPEGLAPMMVNDCLIELEEPGKSLAKAALKVLACLVKATRSTAYLAIYAFMDQMMKMFTDPEIDLAVRAPILAGVGELLAVLAAVYRNPEGGQSSSKEVTQGPPQTVKLVGGGGVDSISVQTNTNSDVGSGGGLQASVVSKEERSYDLDGRPLDPFLSELLTSLSNGLRSTSYRRSALHAFSSVVSISILFSTSSPHGSSSVEVEAMDLDEEERAQGDQVGGKEDGKTRKTGPFLSNEEISFLTHNVSEMLTLPLGDEVREEALCAIEVISNERFGGGLTQGACGAGGAGGEGGKTMEKVVLPVLLECLPDRILPQREERSSDVTMQEGEGTQPGLEAVKGKIRRSLGAISRLCLIPQVFDIVVVRLFTKLELCCNKKSEGEEEESEEIKEANKGYARGIILTLQTLLDEKKARGHRDLARHGQNLPQRIVKLVLSGLGDQVTQAGISASQEIVADCSKLLATLVRTIDKNRQRGLMEMLEKAFVKGEGDLVPSHLRGGKFRPLELSASTEEADDDYGWMKSIRDTVALYGAAIVASCKGAGLPRFTNSDDETEIAVELIRRVLGWTLDSSEKIRSELQIRTGKMILCTVVNKFIPEPAPVGFTAMLSKFWEEKIVGLEKATTSSYSKRIMALQVWMWIAKGLVVRSSKEAERMLEKVRSDVFERSGESNQDDDDQREDAWKFSKEAARSLEIVARSDDGVVSKENGCIVRLLYKQRLFSYLLPLVIQGYRSHQSKTPTSTDQDELESGVSGGRNPQTIYLISLSSLLPSLPPTTLTSQLSSLFPLLIQSLSLPDPKARSYSSNTLTISLELGKKIRDDRIEKEKEREVAIKLSGRRVADQLASSTSTSDEVENQKPLQQQEEVDLLALNESHLGTIIKRCNQNFEKARFNSTSTRVSSLRTLTSLARCLPYQALRPYKNQVLSGLASPGRGIDDDKRIVRMAAVDCRDVWYGLEE
ncbi:hypothetical protein IE53DRAFT_378181 [Violaceomyces palustris]|uniref:Uncharacterized protein n=1 Tax=Violaceomyces palustris TaxID=1673888 RepID=A0ACD0P2R9_9BASI|nr:hypothetical protein IE53DRAFT_378181 [Violaceomyces palustris]